MSKSSPFAHLKKGALHKQLGVPQNQKIPVSRLEAAAESHNPLLRKRAHFALNARQFKHSGA